jgi:hypothetical protein
VTTNYNNNQSPHKTQILHETPKVKKNQVKSSFHNGVPNSGQKWHYALFHFLIIPFCARPCTLIALSMTVDLLNMQ